MAAPKAPVLAAKGGAGKDVSLEEAVFGVEVKPHLVHEAVRAEQNAHRAGTMASKSRGMVSGGRSKPWRQKGTGRARAGTTRAAQFTGGGHVFAKVPRSFDLKVNRKACQSRPSLGSWLVTRAEGSLALLDATIVRRAVHETRQRPPRGFWPGRAGARRASTTTSIAAGQVVPQPSEGRGRRALRGRGRRCRLGPHAPRERGRPSAPADEGQLTCTPTRSSSRP